MSLPGQKTTTSFLEWGTFKSLVQKLERDGNYKFASLLYIGVYTGLRISDIKKLKWSHILNRDILVVTETKTGKTKSIRLNPELKAALHRIHPKIQRPDNLILVNRYGTKPINTHYINARLKEIFREYGIKTEGNISTHFMRKTLGRRVVEVNKYSAKSLVLLSEVFNHSTVAITKRYLGIRQEEIDSVYDSL